MHTPVFLGFYSHFWAEIAPGSGAGGNFFDLNIFCGDLSDFFFRFSPGAAKQGKICVHFLVRAHFVRKYKLFSAARCVWCGKIR